MHSSLRIWGQDHSYAETEESGEGRRQTTAQSCVTEGQSVGSSTEAPGASTSLYESDLGDTFTPQSPPTGTGDSREEQ